MYLFRITQRWCPDGLLLKPLDGPMILTAQLNPFGKGKSVPPAAGEDLQQQWRQVAATLCLTVPTGMEARREADSNSLSHSSPGPSIRGPKRTASSDVPEGEKSILFPATASASILSANAVPRSVHPYPIWLYSFVFYFFHSRISAIHRVKDSIDPRESLSVPASPSALFTVNSPLLIFLPFFTHLGKTIFVL